MKSAHVDSGVVAFVLALGLLLGLLRPVVIQTTDSLRSLIRWLKRVI